MADDMETPGTTDRTPPPAPKAETAPSSPPAPTNVTNGLSAKDVAEMFDRLLKFKAGGDPNKLAEMLLKQNLKIKQSLMETEGQVKTLREEVASRSVPDGHVVVSKADAELLASYRALGTPDDLKGKVERLGEVETEVTTRRKHDTLMDVAETMGYVPAVLNQLAEPEWEFVASTEGGRNGKEARTYKVKFKDAAGNEVVKPLREFEDKEWRAFLPALKAAPVAPVRPQAPAAPYRGSETVTGGHSVEHGHTVSRGGKNKLAEILGGLRGI